MVPTFPIKSVSVLAMLWSSPLLAAQCYAPSDPVRLAPDEQRAVVLTARDNPNVFQSDFSLKRTLKNILTTVPGVDPASIQDAQIKDLLNSLLTGFGATTLTNDDGNISFTVAPRDGEKALAPSDLLDDASPTRMVPIALFNRIDLAPADHSHCGEYRIVYAKSGPKNPDGSVVRNQRLFLIFEAVLPNPDPAGDHKQCEAMWRMWKGFAQPGQDQTQIGQTLARFYYEGGDVNGSAKFSPVVSFDHYGISGGQVRANAFVHAGADDANKLNWHLRQWRVALDEKYPTKLPAFQPEPVNETPFRGYFSGDPSSAQGADPNRFSSLAGLFQGIFAQVNVSQLVAVDGTAAIPVDPQATIADLIDHVGVDIDDKFYAVESDSGPFGQAAADDPAVAIGSNSDLGTAIDKQLAALKVGPACGLTRQHVLNRMAAMTCGGCHQFANAKEIAPGVRWPTSLNFVQIDETGAMSNLLLDRFLPFRFQLTNGVPEPSTVALARTAPVQALAVQAPAVQASAVQAAPLRQQLRSELATFSKTRNEASLRTVNDLGARIRKADKAQPGAFVTFRKPD